MKPIITINNVSYSVTDKKIFSQDNTVKILENISFEVRTNTIFGITGESGSGKTTLIKLMAKVLVPTSGGIEYSFPEKQNGISNVQILFQNSEELINPVRKIVNQLHDLTREENKITEIFEILALDQNILHQRGMELSGGERQRVALAKLLLVKPKILICDEPFSAQDPVSKLNFVEIFKTVNEKLNITVICVSHEIDILKLFTKELLVLYGGKTAEVGKADQIFQSPKHPYTDFLLRASNYQLKESDLNLSTDKFTGNYFACGYYNFCSSRSEVCKTSVQKTSFEDRVVYCNHPLNSTDAKGAI